MERKTGKTEIEFQNVVMMYGIFTFAEFPAKPPDDRIVEFDAMKPGKAFLEKNTQCPPSRPDFQKILPRGCRNCFGDSSRVRGGGKEMLSQMFFRHHCRFGATMA